MTPSEIDLVVAEALARLAHFSQKEQSTGDPYIRHVERVVALSVVEIEKLTINLPTYPRIDLRQRVQAVAWLHDVLEDSDILVVDANEKLQCMGFHPETVEPVLLLTRGWYTPYDAPYKEYINHLIGAKNLLALAVKIADLKDHLRPNCPASLRPRYEAALSLLTEVFS